MHRELGLAAIAFLTLPILFSAGQERPNLQRTDTINSFRQIPRNTTIIKSFPYSKDLMLKDLAAQGITLSGITDGRLTSGANFVSGMSVCSRMLHGTADAPFSCDMFSLNDPLGIRFVFDEAKAIFALTLIGPTTNVEARLKLVFYDAAGNELGTVIADTQHQKELGFDSRGAIFRGLSTPTPIITRVDLIPTELNKDQKIVIAGIDYLCIGELPVSSDKPENLDQLVANLSSDDFNVRTKAEDQLVSLGRRVLRFLPNPVAENDAEAKFRLNSVIARISQTDSNPTPNGLVD